LEFLQYYIQDVWHFKAESGKKRGPIVEVS